MSTTLLLLICLPACTSSQPACSSRQPTGSTRHLPCSPSSLLVCLSRKYVQPASLPVCLASQLVPLAIFPVHLPVCSFVCSENSIPSLSCVWVCSGKPPNSSSMVSSDHRIFLLV
ncbi:hypothetical protein AAFF_G00226020 [Aldrovandia affinis]|uniref:Secreted protein n=1 Tax=Aldrovandia affinis TaxID=143900 RepID=A0AAD7TB74_9TELE|nr:hypothetical protein AAFF_G00226020 [Aldrovandia affinis]